jgi:hypothetical protein
LNFLDEGSCILFSDELFSGNGTGFFFLRTRMIFFFLGLEEVEETASDSVALVAVEVDRRLSFGIVRPARVDSGA